MRPEPPRPLAQRLRGPGGRAALDRDGGRQVKAVVHRAGQTEAPRAGCGDGVLLGMSRVTHGSALALTSPPSR